MVSSRPTDSEGPVSGANASSTGFRSPHFFFNGLRVAAILAVIFTLGNATYAAWDQDLTYDEYFHLEWPRRLLHDRSDDRQTEFRFDSKTPILIPAVLAVDALHRYGNEDERDARFVSRLIPIFYLAICLGLVALIARSTDPTTAWLAVLLTALDPNLAAHASVATGDVGYAMAVLLFTLALARAREPLALSAAVGATIGLAFATKFTAVLLLPVAAVFLARRARGFRTFLSGVLVLAAVAVFVVSASYLFVGIGDLLGTLNFSTPLFQKIAKTLPSIPLPFPRSILTGIDASMDHDAKTNWTCYLLGSAHPGGVWYYFIVNWLLKTPLALLALVFVGLGKSALSWRDETARIVATVFSLHLAYFSFFFKTQIGLRFALLCIPLASLAAAFGLARLPARHRVWILVAAGLALAERVPYWADPIAFTNLGVWPKSQAYRYTADSNLDYGQNRERVARYVKESGLSVVSDQTTVTPGLFLVNTNNLTTFGNFRANRWLIDRDIPAIRFGYTDFAFSITGARFEDYMNETRRTPNLASFETFCGGELPHHAPGDKVPFLRTDHPEEDRLWVVCARSRKGVDIGFRLLRGRGYFGRMTADGICAVEFLQAGQVTWARVPPGGKAQLCVRELRYRRSYLPYVFDGELIVRGQGADVEFRAVPKGSFKTPFGQDAVGQ